MRQAVGAPVDHCDRAHAALRRLETAHKAGRAPLEPARFASWDEVYEVFTGRWA
jgi:hypothetical protein